MAEVKLDNVIIPSMGSTRWDIKFTNGALSSKQRSATPSTPEHPPTLLLPPLCHPHVHLDKPYLLTCNGHPSRNLPDYSDLAPTKGTFKEALSNTEKAKARYTADDLYLRGSQLLANSYQHGVTALRVFVEVDEVVELRSLEVAAKLKENFGHLLDIQICAFAQRPIAKLLENGVFWLRNAIEWDQSRIGKPRIIEAIGSTPYVENSRDDQIINLMSALRLAMAHKLHLDYHTDYNLEPTLTEDFEDIDVDSQPLFSSEILPKLHLQRWAADNPGKTVVLGHCTRTTQVERKRLAAVAASTRHGKLPVHYVGLPTSDLYMMDRCDHDKWSLARERGTMQVPDMIKEFGMDACIGINNVGNPFTPFGNADPLQLASWGVGIYHAGTLEDAKLLYECVSTRARRAIFGDDAKARAIRHAEGNKHPAVIANTTAVAADDEQIHLPLLEIDNEVNTVIYRREGRREQVANDMVVPPRWRLGYKDVVWDPPETRLREIIWPEFDK